MVLRPGWCRELNIPDVVYVVCMRMCACVCVYKVCKLMSDGVYAIFATHTVSSLSTVRSYGSTFQIPVIMSRVAVNTSKALLSAATPSLHAALTSIHNPPAVDPGTPIVFVCSVDDIFTCNPQNVCDRLRNV